MLQLQGDSVPRPPAGASPLDPTGGLPSIRPPDLPPPPTPPSRSAPVQAMVKAIDAVQGISLGDKFPITLQIWVVPPYPTVRNLGNTSQLPSVPTIIVVHAAYSVYSTINWLECFFRNHSHCTSFDNQLSVPLDISASIVQGSVLGLASYVVTASDLHWVSSCNVILKYADDIPYNPCQ